MKRELLQRISRMSDAAIYHELYCDHLTGCLNRKAYEHDDRPAYAIIDLDSLKYVNDTMGHRWGDYQLNAVAATLTSTFSRDDVYRLSGDEFAVKGYSVTLLNGLLKQAEKALPTFSYGVGSSLEAADKRLIANKAMRERNGLRATRGECPPWIDQLTCTKEA